MCNFFNISLLYMSLALLYLYKTKKKINLNQKAMNEDQFKGKWNQIKGEVKQKYAELTNDDLKYAEGKSDELLGRLQEKTGKTKEQLKDEIDKW